MVSWKEENWDEGHAALENAVRAIRLAERTMLDRMMPKSAKDEVITVQLHRIRRSLDECAAALEQDEMVTL